jgi:hypothetical protein
MPADYNEFIQRVLQQEVVDTVYKRRIDILRRLFPTQSPVGGDRITEKFEVARSSPASAYTKASVNPSPASNTIVKPYWAKTFYHTACEIEGIDIANAKNGGTDIDLVRREITMETASLMDVIFSALMTQIKADVDSTSVAYSDASLSRSTYATLASYEEATDTAITIALTRGMINAVTLNKNCGPKSGYVILMEEAVYNVFNPLAGALQTWTLNDVGQNQAVDTGYRPAKSFEQVDVEVPSGMTIGDVFMLRRQDVKLTEHMPMEIEQVPSGRHSVMFVIRVGIDVHVIHPGFQGKMTSKD